MGWENEHPLVVTLRTLIGDDARVTALLRAALAAASRTDLPSEPNAILTFLWAHVLPRVDAQLGPRAALSLVDGVRARLEVGCSSRSGSRAHAEPERSGVQLKKVRAFVVNADPFARSRLARELVRAGVEVTTLEALGAPDIAIDDAEVVVVGVHESKHLSALAAAVGVIRIGLLIILAHHELRGSDLERVGHAADARRWELLPLDTPLESLTSLIGSFLDDDARRTRAAR